LARNVPTAEKELERLHHDAISRMLPSIQDESRDRDVDPVVCESWINKTMNKVPRSSSPDVNIAVNAQSRVDYEPLRKSGLDRKSLQQIGLPNKLIQRLHRMLYVYSAGFHQVLTEVTMHLRTHLITTSVARGVSSDQEPADFMKRVWLTFLMLLESCDRKHYGTILSSIMDDHTQALARTEDTFKKRKEEDLFRIEALAAESGKLTRELEAQGTILMEQRREAELIRMELEEGRRQQEQQQERNAALVAMRDRGEDQLKAAAMEMAELRAVTAKEKAAAQEQEERRSTAAAKARQQLESQISELKKKLLEAKTALAFLNQKLTWVSDDGGSKFKRATMQLAKVKADAEKDIREKDEYWRAEATRRATVVRSDLEGAMCAAAKNLEEAEERTKTHLLEAKQAGVQEMRAVNEAAKLRKQQEEYKNRLGTTNLMVEQLTRAKTKAAEELQAQMHRSDVLGKAHAKLNRQVERSMQALQLQTEQAAELKARVAALNSAKKKLALEKAATEKERQMHATKAQALEAKLHDTMAKMGTVAKGAAESRRKSNADMHAARLEQDGRLRTTMQTHDQLNTQLVRQLEEAQSALNGLTGKVMFWVDVSADMAAEGVGVGGYEKARGVKLSMMEAEAKEKALAEMEAEGGRGLDRFDVSWLKQRAGRAQLRLEDRLTTLVETVAQDRAKATAAALKLDQQWHAHEKVKAGHREGTKQLEAAHERRASVKLDDAVRMARAEQARALAMAEEEAAEQRLLVQKTEEHRLAQVRDVSSRLNALTSKQTKVAESKVMAIRALEESLAQKEAARAEEAAAAANAKAYAAAESERAQLEAKEKEQLVKELANLREKYVNIDRHEIGVGVMEPAERLQAGLAVEMGVQTKMDMAMLEKVEKEANESVQKKERFEAERKQMERQHSISSPPKPKRKSSVSSMTTPPSIHKGSDDPFMAAAVSTARAGDETKATGSSTSCSGSVGGQGEARRLSGSAPERRSSKASKPEAAKLPDVQRQAIMEAPAELLREALAQRAAKDRKASAAELDSLGL
jgi:hypothetical protein